MKIIPIVMGVPLLLGAIAYMHSLFVMVNDTLSNVLH
jgi:hypothetical protein